MEIRPQSAFPASLALLLGDTVMHGSQLQIVMTVWSIFLNYGLQQGATHLTQRIQILKKCAKQHSNLQRAIVAD